MGRRGLGEKPTTCLIFLLGFGIIFTFCLHAALLLGGSILKNMMCCLILLLASVGISLSQNFTVADSGTFKQKDGSLRKVFLVQDSTKRMILFQTNLQVNTDGTPMSYHPFDLRGDSVALNRIDNAIVVYRSDKKTARSSQAISVFEKWRDSDYEVIPDGYSIVWKNVLFPETINGKEKPCIFKTGKYKGYYSSATSLQNGLTSHKGECDCNNQTNPLEIPGLVLAGGNSNIVRKFGAKIGDLVIAYNPDKKKIVYAIINDSGPPDNLGEGSVSLNMKLLDKTEYPQKRKDTL